MDFKPHKYQEYAIQRIIDDPAVGLFLEMGLGKTLCALTAVSELMYDRFDVAKVLVIAPLKTAEDTWSGEIEKWAHLNYLKLSKVLGTQKKRIAALEEDADIYIINRENVEWLVNWYATAWPFDMVVIDELSSFKNHKAKRFLALKAIRPLIKRVVGLTGTPSPNGLIDLWSQIYLLDQGQRLGKCITHYRNRYFYEGQKSGHIVYKWEEKPEADTAVHKAISDICVSMKAEDWLDMPEILYNRVEINLSLDIRKAYRQFERDLLLPHKDGDITVNGAAALTNKLLQYANGAVYDEDRNVREIHNTKLQKLEEIIDCANGQPVLIYYSYQHDLARIQKYIKGTRILKTSKDIKDWNAGKIPVLLAHPASAGHGLNLQAGGNIIVWFGLTWNLEFYQQANARLYRQGQIKNVIIHHIIAYGTMDEEVMERLILKEKGQDLLMGALKARIDKVVKNTS
jgi:SNF2 family DNA or RNA helicase